jgi:L-fucose isomerase-like protein
MSGRFEYLVVSSALHDAVAVDQLTAPVRAVLDSVGGRPVGTTEPAGPERDGPRPLLYVVATGGTERAIIDAVAERRVSHGDEPVVLVAHRAHNSLPAALESLAAVHQTGGRGRIVFVTGDETTDRRELDEAVVDLETMARLRATRLGLIGGPSSWLVASSPEPAVVRRRWGPEVVVVEPSRMIELTRTPVVPTGVLAERFTRVADPTRSTIDRDAVSDAMAVHAALGDVLEEHRLDAVTVRCFDLLTDPGTSGCLALASLNDDGIVAGCEGDLPSALAMLLVRYLLGQPSWMANPASVDLDTDTVVLAHCTVAPSMIEGFALDTHFESGQGVGISGHFAPQPVTLVRVGGRDLDESWIVEGEIVATGDDADLCRTQVTVALAPGSVRALLEHPLGNHLVLASGHHGARLGRWWAMAVADRP